MARKRERSRQAPRRFDALMKRLVEAAPTLWIQRLGFDEPASAEPVNPNLATIVREADTVPRVEAPDPYLVHVEYQSRRDVRLPRRLLQYNVLLNGRYNLPVETVALLLWPRADGPELTGVVELPRTNGAAYLRFEYRVVRPWQLAVEELLAGPLVTLPLVALAGLKPPEPRAVAGRIRARLETEPPAEAWFVATATGLLLSGRYRPELVRQIVEGMREMMQETWFYQSIMDEGRVEGQKRVLLRLGEKRFGRPDARTRTALEAVTDLQEIERLTDRLLDAASWEELLARP